MFVSVQQHVVCFPFCFIRGTKVVQISPTSLPNQTGGLRLSVRGSQEVSQHCGLWLLVPLAHMCVRVSVIVPFVTVTVLVSSSSLRLSPPFFHVSFVLILFHTSAKKYKKMKLGGGLICVHSSYQLLLSIFAST